MRQGKSLRKKLIPAFFAASCIPIALLAVISQTRLRTTARANLEQQAEAGLVKADECMDMVMDKYQTILYDAVTEDELVEAAEELNDSGDGLEVRAAKLRREFSHVCNRNLGIEGMQMILKDGGRIFYDRLSSSSADSDWIEQIRVPDVAKVLSCGTDRAADRLAGEPMMQISRKIIDYQDIHREIGTVILSVNMQVMEDAVSSGTRADIYLAQDGQIISAADRGMIGREAVPEDAGAYLVHQTNEASGMELYLSQPLDEYRETVWEQVVFWLLIAVVMLVIQVALIYRVTRPVMNSVDSIVDAMGKMEQGDFGTRLEVKDRDSAEIRRISSGFNEMVLRTSMLINRVKESALEQKNAEISALEAQIDPHFLYNTLDTINWKAIESEQYEISDMLGALADILRYAVKNPGEETAIEAELVWLKQYILLWQAKLGEAIELQAEVEPELEDRPIHKLLMQPFIENAVKYGFHGNEGPHRLKIQIGRDGERIHIIIGNNGIPMERQTLEALNAGREKKGHLGTANVRKRLRLYYGGDAALHYEQGEAGGDGWTIKVHLFIPLDNGGTVASKHPRAGFTREGGNTT